jgi:hypothetical protein
MLEKRRSASRDEAPGPALGPPATVAPPLPPAVAKGAKEEVLARHDAPEPAPKPSAFAGAPAELEADAVKNEAPGRSSGAAAETWPRPRVQGGAAAGRVAANAIPGSTPSELRYQSLVGRPASTAAEARSLREAWRAFAESAPTRRASAPSRPRPRPIGSRGKRPIAPSSSAMPPSTWRAPTPRRRRGCALSSRRPRSRRLHLDPFRARSYDPQVPLSRA